MPCGRNSAVECQLPKLDVVGSSPIARSMPIFSLQFFFLRVNLVADYRLSGLCPLFYFILAMKNYSDAYVTQITGLIEPLIESEDMELVCVECVRVKTRWLVRIYIDKEGGITVDDCAGISHQVGDILDVHELPPGSYTLEVSSPGLDRPLVRDRDFRKYRGCRVKVRTCEKINGQRNFTGRLIDYLEEERKKNLILDVDGKIHNIPREVVIKANLQYEF